MQLRADSSSASIKDLFDQPFDVATPKDHIHGAILTFCTPGFPTARNLEILSASQGARQPAGRGHRRKYAKASVVSNAIAHLPRSRILPFKDFKRSAVHIFDYLFGGARKDSELLPYQESGHRSSQWNTNHSACRVTPIEYSASSKRSVDRKLTDAQVALKGETPATSA